MDKKVFVIGRCGDIRLDDESVSKQHAEIQIRGNEIYLRDLNSTNGTYLLKNNRLIHFYEGYVQYNQQVVFGEKIYSICALLDMVDMTPFKIDLDNCA